MAELGALTLRIEEQGGAAVLRQVQALDKTAKQAGVSIDAAAKVLTKLGISAKVVGGQIQVAEGQTAKAAAIVQKLGVTAQVTAAQEQKLATATQQVSRSQQQMAGTTATATGRLSLFGREVVTSSGRLSAFSTRAITGLNAAAFAISGLASGGAVSFRSLASAAAGFAAFFGPGGAIASIAVTAGLAISDFFTRTRREIAETRRTAEEALDALILARRERDDPAGVAVERLALARQLSAAANQEFADLVELGNLRQMSAQEQEVHNRMLDAAATRKTAALNREMEALRLVNDARKAASQSESTEVETLAASIAARQANSSEIARATALLGRARFALEQTRNANVEDTATMAARASALKTVTTLTDAFKKATDAVTEAEQKRRKGIADQITQLASLSSLNKLSGQQLVQLQALYAQLNAEVLAGNVTLERRAEIETQLQKIRDASLQAPALREQPLGGGVVGPGVQVPTGVVGPPKTIEIPASLRAKLDPAQIQADVQRAASLMAERVRAFNFTELTESLSQSLGNALATGIAGGFVHGLAQGGIADGFAQMTGQMLSGLGNAAISFALASQEISALMTTIAESLASLNPWVALAAGVALAALGAKLGGAAHRSFSGGSISGGGGFSGGSTVPLNIRRLIVDPNAERVGGRLPRISTNQLPTSGPTVQQFGRPIVATSPEGQRVLTDAVGRGRNRGIG